MIAWDEADIGGGCTKAVAYSNGVRVRVGFYPNEGCFLDCDAAGFHDYPLEAKSMSDAKVEAVVLVTGALRGKIHSLTAALVELESP